jgi:hypothetical protein
MYMFSLYMSLIKRPLKNSRWCHWIFQISFRPYHGPGVESAPSENEYQEHSWGCVRLTTSPTSRDECHEIWEPKPPEPSGPHRACNGTPLPFILFSHLDCLKDIRIILHHAIYKQ